MGDHTDYCGGLVLPVAIHLGIELTARPAERISLVSDGEAVELSADGSGMRVAGAATSPPLHWSWPSSVVRRSGWKESWRQICLGEPVSVPRAPWRWSSVSRCAASPTST